MKVKETFCSYTDFGDETTKKMTEEISVLKNELDKTRNIVRIQRVRYQQLVSLFSAKLREKEEEARNDLQAKHVQLTRILRSLYVLESRLRKEQRALKTTLNERDALIRTQENEITKLRTELEKIVRRCTCPRAKDDAQQRSASVEPTPMKPDLISSIGIEILRQDNADLRKVQNDQAADEKTFVIPSLDDYDVSRTTLRVKEPNNDEGTDYASAVENDENANDENKRNRTIDERLHNEMRKFKMKEDRRCSDTFKADSPRKILKEVTENPNEKLNGPVLKCIKQILSQDGGQIRKPDKQRTKTSFKDINGNANGRGGKGYHPVKPPKPVLKPQTVVSSFETNVPNSFCSHSNTLTVKPLPKITEDVGTVESNDDYEGVNVSNQQRSYVEEPRVNGVVDVKKETLVTDESKIVQTVSALLSDSTESEEDSSIETPPNVSQMVKKFEGLKGSKIVDSKHANAATQLISPLDSMVFQTNFEEFHLVDKEIESTCEDIVNDKATRLEAEGEENTVVSAIIETNCPATAKYETFLEVTGLSQKSILTPSRILSNHRHVMKPKDVKYRSRVKAAATGDKCNNNNNNGCVPTSPTIKYWTEPYL